MPSYVLEKYLELMDMILKLLVGHLPEIYTRDIIPKVLEAKKEMQKDLDREKKKSI
jgi:hypothetical protein